MKKVFSILVAVALVLGLSMVGMPVWADNDPEVTVVVDPPKVSEEAEYLIAFNLTFALSAGVHSITVQFPAETTVPGTYETGDITVNDHVVSGAEVTVHGTTVEFLVPEYVPSGEVDVVFTNDAGIVNPSGPDLYTLWVSTSRETPGVSEDYEISLAEKSIYEFVYDVPQMIFVDDPVEVDITLQTKVLGLEGYDHVRVKFWKEGPGSVLFEAQDSEGAWHEFEDEGYWGPAGGFPVAPEYEATTHFKLTFDTVGYYTIVLQLLDVEDGENVLVQQEETVAVAGVSMSVELNKGWNLMSLPIIPDDSNIEVVLADIMDDVISVWYYDAVAGKWLTFVPDAPSDLGTIEDGKAYWVHMQEEAKGEDALTVVGVAIVLPGEMPPAYGVVEGWNMVGFKSMTPMTAEDYLQGTDWVRIYSFHNGTWSTLSASQSMDPGLGYWVAFSEPGTIYP